MLKFTLSLDIQSCETYIGVLFTIFGQCINVLNDNADYELEFDAIYTRY